MVAQRVRIIYAASLLLLDTVLAALAFVLAYQLRSWIPWPAELANAIPLVRYVPVLFVHVFSIVATLFFYRQYVIPRAVSRIDQLYAVFAAVSIGTMMSVAVIAFLFKNTSFEVEYPRAMIIYAWLTTIMLLMMGRTLHQAARDGLQRRGWGRDRLIIVGTGDVARIILQRVLWATNLGYELVGLVNSERSAPPVMGVPVLGVPEDLPTIIDEYAIDEVMIVIPEQGHREVVRVISYCERGRVTIKVFPDIFQFMTSQATIDDLGGLPLLSVRDFAMRGYLMVFKRLIDIAGSLFGLVVLSPLMLLVAVAIKLESPGPVFFVQDRMGLDGKPFSMVKFRSMRQDAEKDGPGWTTDNDPRRTKLGTFLRNVDIDELPQLINVFMGEMSLVGPRPEQPYYVEQFRRSVPRYMERHREKAGMTGWAQVNGLRGDTSILERTKYDLWYTENWSIWLDLKILLRTFWNLSKATLRALTRPLRRRQPVAATSGRELSLTTDDDSAAEMPDKLE